MLSDQNLYRIRDDCMDAGGRAMPGAIAERSRAKAAGEGRPQRTVEGINIDPT